MFILPETSVVSDILAVPHLPNNLTHRCYFISSFKNLKSYLNVSDLWGDEVQQVCPILQTSLVCLLRAPARLSVSSIAPFARSGVVSN